MDGKVGGFPNLFFTQGNDHFLKPPIKKCKKANKREIFFTEGQGLQGFFKKRWDNYGIILGEDFVFYDLFEGDIMKKRARKR